MKICFVLDDGLDSSDGVQQYVVGLGRWLTGQGHKVHYLVGQTTRTDIANVHVLARNVSVRFNANRLNTPLPASRSKMKELVESEMFDVLHIQVPYSPFMAGRVIKYAPERTALVGTFHILPYSKMQQLGVKAWGLLLRRNAQRIAQMIAVSLPAAELCQSSLKKKALVIGNHVTIKNFEGVKPKKDNNTVKMVFLGRLVERKGIIDLLEVIKIIRKKQMLDRPLKVDIGGDGPLKHRVTKYISENDLGSIVSLHGKIDEKSKSAFLAQADVAVFPSTGGESFGIVLIEAMAAKAGVVVGGDNTGYRSVLGNDENTIIDIRRHELAAKQLTKLCNERSLRAQIHKKQQAIVKDYDVSVIGRKLLAVYEGLAKTSHPRQT